MTVVLCTDLNKVYLPTTACNNIQPRPFSKAERMKKLSNLLDIYHGQCCGRSGNVLYKIHQSKLSQTSLRRQQLFYRSLDTMRGTKTPEVSKSRLTAMKKNDLKR